MRQAMWRLRGALKQRVACMKRSGIQGIEATMFYYQNNASQMDANGGTKARIP